jgi:hypothetical protein
VLVGGEDCYMLVTIKVYGKRTARHLTAEECMEVTHWNGILTAAGEMRVNRSMRFFRLRRCTFFTVILLEKAFIEEIILSTYYFLKIITISIGR